MVAGAAGVGGSVPWLLGAFERPAVEQAAPTLADTDTRYELSIKPEASE